MTHRLAFCSFIAVLTIAGCSGNSSKPCTVDFILDPEIYGSDISPANGATAVPVTARTLVLAASSQSAVVLRVSGGSGANIQTSPTALPSAYPATSGDFAVSIPTLQAATTYAVGTLTDANQCVGDFRFYQYGTFTTQ